MVSTPTHGSAMDRFRVWLEDTIPDRFQPHNLLGGGGDSPVHRRGRVWGNFSYNFTLQFEQCSKHDGLCQTGILVAAASSKISGHNVPLRCRWMRKIGNHSREIPGITGSQYHASADDVGVHIICQAEPLSHDPEAQGIAFGQIGPFELDPTTRLSVENLIVLEGSRFPVRHFRDAGDQRPRDLQIHVKPTGVKVVHPGANDEVVAHYAADFPKVVLDPQDTCHFRLELSEDKEKAYHFVALSRASRDLIVLLIRCFQARAYIVNTFTLGRLSQQPNAAGQLNMNGGAPEGNLAMYRAFDVGQLAEGLQKELDRAATQLESVDKVVVTAQEEKAQLQTQLRETISSYTEVIEKLHQQIAMARGGQVANLQLQLHDARQLNSKLQLELQESKKQTEEEMTRSTTAYGKEAEKLSEEIASLQASIRALSMSMTAPETSGTSQRDQNREQELRRLRQDVDELCKEKEGLERNVQQADREKQDLIENFLHVKGALDKLQLACLDMPEASPEVTSQLQKLKADYSQAVDERNRLAVKVESMDRDREKDKTQREATLERVMNSNARLMEERDRLQQERVRISTLYQNTMAAMGADEASMAQTPSAAATQEPAAENESVEALEAILAEKAERLQKCEQEGESLRSRLRKLAMV